MRANCGEGYSPRRGPRSPPGSASASMPLSPAEARRTSRSPRHEAAARPGQHAGPRNCRRAWVSKARPRRMSAVPRSRTSATAPARSPWDGRACGSRPTARRSSYIRSVRHAAAARQGHGRACSRPGQTAVVEMQWLNWLRQSPRGGQPRWRAPHCSQGGLPASLRGGARRRGPVRGHASVPRTEQPVDAHRRPRATADLERDVAVLAAGPRLALRQRGLERVDQHRTRAARLDHVVDVAALGGAVRVRELLLVVGDQLRALVVAGSR